jgi:ABC-2 type transport system permease protein
MTGVSSGRVFLAILWRDVFVTLKESWILLIQIAVVPTFLLFVFAKVLVAIDVVRPGFGPLLLCGVLALAAFLTGLYSVAQPLVAELGTAGEIEDRLLAPIATSLIALEKMVSGAFRGMLASAFMFPIGALVLGSAPWRPAGTPLLLTVLALGAWTGAALGVTVATLVPPRRIFVVFELLFTPLPFTGAIQYPFTELDRIRWFQVVNAMNPLTYCSEGVRAALVPEVPHLAPWLCVTALVAFALVFTWAGISGFVRRAVP